MKCKDVTAKIDLGQIPTSLVGRTRFQLHLSLCRACRYYFHSSNALKAVARQMIQSGEQTVDLIRLNRDLVKKFTLK